MKTSSLDYVLFLANKEKPTDMASFIEGIKKTSPELFKPVNPANSGVNDLNKKPDAKPPVIDIKNMSPADFKAHMSKQGVRV